MDPPRKGLPSPAQIVQGVQNEIDEVFASVLEARRSEGLTLPADVEEELRCQIKKRTYKKISQGVLDAYISGRYTQIEAKEKEPERAEVEELFHKSIPPPKKPPSPEKGDPDWPVDPKNIELLEEKRKA